MKNKTYSRPIQKSFIIAMSLAILIASPLSHHGIAKEASSAARIAYYIDARGVFTLTPPPASTGYLLPLEGTCSLPALMIRIAKKNAGSSPRQITYIMKGNKYNFKYIIKDGPGEYAVTIFGKKTVTALNLNGLCAFTVRSDAALPKNFGGLDIGESILSHAKSVMGKTVGSGECWDLAQEALDAAGADWNRPFQFGRELNPDRDDIRAGDIIQFTSVRIEKRFENGRKMFRTLGAPDHTAIILGIEGKKKFKLAHQNTDGKRYVISSEIDLNDMVSGKFRIYRPVAGIVR